MTTSDEREADDRVQQAWQESVKARFALVETQIEKMEVELRGLRESLQGVCEP